METFTGPKPLVTDPHFYQQRQAHLSRLHLETIDPPIRDLISDLGKLRYCYTLQSCFGHFLPSSQGDIRTIAPLPPSGSTATVRYRIAYVALCIANNDAGRALLKDLQGVPSIDPGYVQFGSAEWFWARLLNTYAVQVEPARYMTQDEARVDYEEALHIQEVRDRFFAELTRFVDRHLARMLRDKT